MLKQILYFVVASLLAVFFIHQVASVLHHIGSLHSFVHPYFDNIFAVNWLGRLLRGTIELIIVPGVLTLIPGAIYWLIKRRRMPYLYHLMWGLWLISLILVATT